MNEFDEQLNKADLILGNLMIDHGAKSTYGKSMESGLPFSMIKKAKPCLMIKGYNYPINLQSSVVEYSDNNDLKRILEGLVSDNKIGRKLKKSCIYEFNAI